MGMARPCSSVSTYKVLARQDLYANIAQAEKDLDDGKGQDAFEALAEIRAKHHV